MTRRAGDVVDGLLLAARAIGAREAIVFLKKSFDRPADALEKVLASTDTRGVSVRVHRGDDSYVAGEETALLESLEGRRAWPRPKPPRPAAVGLGGRPTLVQNVETLSRVPAAVKDPEGFAATEATLVTLWGDVARPGVYEVSLGTALSRVIEGEGGGAPDGLGMVFPGGPAGPPLGPDQLETPLDPHALSEAGTALGTGAVLVVGASACPLAVAASVAAFFERENCGQCPPCAVGTASLARILGGLESGRARPRELGHLADAAGFMSGHGYCAHAAAAAGMATGLVHRFAGEVEAHLDKEGCPDPDRRHPDPFAPGSPEQAAVEAAVAEQGR
jgi:NADH-quinone oxidoreductase subunit F